MSIISVVLLFIASIGASIAAGSIFGSSVYSTSSKARSAHSYLTAAAVLGWSSIAILIIILLVAAWSGVFTTVTIPESWSTAGILTRQDLATAMLERKQLSEGHGAQILVLIFLIIIAIITFIIGILAAIAAGEIAAIAGGDSRSRNAYTWSVVAAVGGIGGIVAMFIAVLVYMSLRSTMAKEVQTLNAEIAAAKAAGVQ